MKHFINTAYWLGSFSFMLFVSIVQDLLGKERYLALARKEWIPHTLPIEIFLFVSTVVIFFYIRHLAIKLWED